MEPQGGSSPLGLGGIQLQGLLIYNSFSAFPPWGHVGMVVCEKIETSGLLTITFQGILHPSCWSLSSERYVISTFYDNADGGDDQAFPIEMLMKFLLSQGARVRRLCAFVHRAVFEPSPSLRSIFMLHATCTLPLSFLPALLSELLRFFMCL